MIDLIYLVIAAIVLNAILLVAIATLLVIGLVRK
jgi:hypothetical protein